MLVHIHQLGGGFATLTPVSAVDPGFGTPGGERPDQGLPGGGARPDQGLPWAPGRPDQGLPPSPGRPDQGLPRPPMNPAFPDNSLPSGPPPNVTPGATLVLVRDQAGVWHYAAIPPGQPAPVPWPEPPKPAPKN